MVKILGLCFVLFVINSESAKILGWFPTASVSHQVVYRPLMHELAKRGHDVYIVTTDPVFTKSKAPQNLTEIDVHDISYSKWMEFVIKSGMTTGSKDDFTQQIPGLFEAIYTVFEAQLASDIGQKIIRDNTVKFDLIFHESFAKPSLILSHYYKASTILISSLLPLYNNMEVVGSPSHPILYPMGVCRQKIYNLTTWEKVTELYNYYKILYKIDSLDALADRIIKKHFGADSPSVYELQNNVDMLFVNVHPIWDMNRPVSPSTIYLGGMHRNPVKDLPKDLQEYLDSSKHGVIYISFGTNVDPSLLPKEKIEMLTNVVSRMPYDVMWKWTAEPLPNCPKNVRTFTWLPQSDLLRHPKILLFITQGGLQSTDEAIAAGVPMFGIPMLADQWYNVEQYVHHKIGRGLLMDDFTEEKLKENIEIILNDKSYRQNILKLRDVMNDRPENSLQRAVWWTEHVLRHGGAKHLRSPAANISWAQYLELEAITYVLLSLFIIFLVITTTLYYLIKCILRNFVLDKNTVKKDD